MRVTLLVFAIFLLLAAAFCLVSPIFLSVPVGLGVFSGCLLLVMAEWVVSIREDITDRGPL